MRSATASMGVDDSETNVENARGNDVPAARALAMESTSRLTMTSSSSSSFETASESAGGFREETNAMRRFRLASAVSAARKTPAASPPKPGRRVARKATLGHPQTRPRVTKAVKVARSAPRSIPSGGDARDGREPRKRTASDVFAPSAGAGPSTPSPAKKKAKKRASGARAPVGERKVKGKRSVAADGKKRLVDEDLANCYAAMHSCTDLGDVEQCETMRKYFCSMASQFANPYNWWHEVVPCAARDSKRPIEVLTWALERGAPLDPKAALSACERAPHPLRTTAEGAYTSAVDVLAFLHKRNCTIDEDTLYCAAEFGELDCLKYMIEQVPGCRVANWPEHKTPKGYDNNIMAVSAKNGHLGVLQYLYDVGCDFAPEDAVECIWQTMNRSPSSPILWHAVVRWVQSTEEYRQINANVDFLRPLGEPDP